MAMDDEPLDDARAVATAAAAAAARVVETVAREARDYQMRQRATLERAQDQQRARQALAGLRIATGTDASSAGYDSLEQRQIRAANREAAGVPADARQVRAAADLMNGADPATAAARGQDTSTGAAARVARPGRQATRTR